MTNLEKARQSVIDSAFMWRTARIEKNISSVMRLASEQSLLSALEDLESVQQTGEFPPGKWEQM